MYVAYGTSSKSENQAFERAMKMLKYMDVKIKSMRLDKYYSSSSYVTKFDDTKVYVILKNGYCPNFRDLF
jgi:transposase